MMTKPALRKCQGEFLPIFANTKRRFVRIFHKMVIVIMVRSVNSLMGLINWPWDMVYRKRNHIRRNADLSGKKDVAIMA